MTEINYNVVIIRLMAGTLVPVPTRCWAKNDVHMKNILNLMQKNNPADIKGHGFSKVIPLETRETI